uniref:VOC domain-containing protein n=1 Tax=Acrobeloides nanus TaxID=290746 RepID=A0A914DWC9_9BILA
MNETKRWVVVGPHNPNNQPITDILLAKADGTNQIHQIGNQTGGRVGFFLLTNDFNASYEKMKLGGVDFVEEPRNEKHGIVVQFNDLYGNKWELIQKTDINSNINLVTIVVREYDEAISWFTQNLGFELKANETRSETKRWVVVGPPNPENYPKTNVLLAKADGNKQIQTIGNQAGGRVGFFLSVDNFNVNYDKMKPNGVEFLEEPRHEEYGIVVQFKDLYGNKWDMIQRFS